MAQKKRVRRTKAEIEAGISLDDKIQGTNKPKPKTKSPAKKAVIPKAKIAKKKITKKKKSDNWKSIELASKRITIGTLDKLYGEGWRFAFAQENKDGNLELFFQKDNSVQK